MNEIVLFYLLFLFITFPNVLKICTMQNFEKILPYYYEFCVVVIIRVSVWLLERAVSLWWGMCSLSPVFSSSCLSVLCVKVKLISALPQSMRKWEVLVVVKANNTGRGRNGTGRNPKPQFAQLKVNKSFCSFLRQVVNVKKYVQLSLVQTVAGWFMC